MKRRTAWTAVMLAPALALLSGPAASTTYDLSEGCVVKSGFQNGSLVAGSGPAYTPGTCPGSGALTSVQAISNTGLAGIGGSAVTGALQAAYIGVYGTAGSNAHLGVTSTAGVTNTTTTSDKRDGNTGALAAATPNTATTNNTSGYAITTGSGITNESQISPSHAMDNQYNIEAMLLTFDPLAPVSLQTLQLGWYNTDSDLTLYAYMGTGCTNTGLPGGTPVSCAAASALTGGTETWGGTASSLTNNGWVKIGDYADAGGNPTAGSVDSPSKVLSVANTTFSSKWLIAAYTGSAAGTGLSTGNDYVKLMTASAAACIGTQCGTGGSGGSAPEPSTVLLMGAALLALTQMRRDRTA